MKIVFDLSQSGTQKTGIENYYNGLANSYLEISKDEEIVLLSNDSKYLEEFDDRYTKLVIKSKRPNFLWMLRVAVRLRKIKADIFLAQSNFLFSLIFNKTIQVVYDLGPFIHPEFYEKAFVKKFKRQFSIAVSRSKAMVTISETTRKDVIRIFPKAEGKTANIGTGLNSLHTRKTKVSIKEVKSKFGIGENYILSVGTLQPRKNYLEMIRGFARFKKFHPNYQYVIVGKKGWLYDKILAEASSLGIEESVVFTDFVEQDELIQLYRNTRALVNCSLFEGFGLPLIEAYSQGISIVASDILIFNEVMEDKAFFVNPHKPSEIADGIDKAIKSKAKPSKALLEKYDWNIVAGKLHEVFELIYKGK